MPFVDDTEEIHQLLYSNLERVLDRFHPDWMKVGKLALLTPKKTGTRYASSYQMELEGGDRGSWRRYSQKIGGAPINYVAYELTGNHKGRDAYARAYEWCREYFGLEKKRTESDEDRQERERKINQRREANARRQQEQQQKTEARKMRRAETAREVAEQCQLLKGTLAEAYLIHRKLPPMSEWPSDQRAHIGFHPALEYDPLRVYENKRLVRYGPDFPAIVFFIRDPFGDVVAMQRIFLSQDGRKLETERPDLDSKVTYGSYAGGVCRIGGDGPRVGLMEGPETALGLWFLHNCRFPMWACISTGGMEAFQAPSFVERLDLFQDGDKAVYQKNRHQTAMPPGARSAAICLEKQTAVGLKVVPQEMPALGDGLELWETFQAHAE
ncbi:hypothetical protein TRICHSKD4_3701 [Roseibium sp. TrichSKD4]|uniref:DUF7146 domain-containing protein n=1 Tax=Roseibium sp. TrichSKD4 TaxID=744980 RepID=UPI0001E56B52|nr:hypothetical protein [Roseibium sp. TrichSKD4]EFO30126.1 hypothetical protein TRICHSKD4_3701 [Roseibium sp. TrichSKD4]